MKVQRVRFEAGKAIRDAGESLAEAIHVFQSLVQAEIFHPVDTDLDAQEGAELLVHTAHQVLAVDARPWSSFSSTLCSLPRSRL